MEANVKVVSNHDVNGKEPVDYAKVKTIDIGPMTDEEERMSAALVVLTDIKSKSSVISTQKAIKTLQDASRLQGVSMEVKKSTLRELRRQKLMLDLMLVDFN